MRRPGIKPIWPWFIGLLLVFGSASPALAHTATHFHGGLFFIAFHTDTSVTASEVNLVGCSSIGSLSRRWEDQRHYTRQNSSAPWQYSHTTTVTGSWFWGSC